MGRSRDGVKGGRASGQVQGGVGDPLFVPRALRCLTVSLRTLVLLYTKKMLLEETRRGCAH